MRKLTQKIRIWPIAGSFRIAHGSVSQIEVVQVTITQDGFTGRGECRPYARYGETAATVATLIQAAQHNVESGMSQKDLQSVMSAGAARNAVDCALWDLRAKQENTKIWDLLGTPPPKPRLTAFTLSIDTPAKMAKAARAAQKYPILKLKIGGPEGLDACLAVMQARPDAQLIVDANEALTPVQLKQFQTTLSALPVLTIEQPLKADQFDQISNHPNDLPILCADESLHTREDLGRLWAAGYRAVNVKLDKCGGLTEAVAVMKEAKAMGFLIMAGCMVGTSLAMAPMMVLESYADFIDLDGPLLLAKDIKDGLQFDGPYIHPPRPALWG